MRVIKYVPEPTDDLAIGPRTIRKHTLHRSQRECGKRAAAALQRRLYGGRGPEIAARTITGFTPSTRWLAASRAAERSARAAIRPPRPRAGRRTPAAPPVDHLGRPRPGAPRCRAQLPAR